MRQAIETEIAGYLKPGETIKWLGQPIGGLRLKETDMIVIPNSIILFAFGSILSIETIRFEANFVFVSFGFILTLLGLYLIFPRLILEKLKREATYYFITSHRVLVLSGRRKRKFQSLPLQAITILQITDEKNDEGYISFSENNALFSWLLGRFFTASDHIPGFDKIKNVTMVFEILVQARENVVGGFPKQNLN